MPGALTRSRVTITLLGLALVIPFAGQSIPASAPAAPAAGGRVDPGLPRAGDELQRVVVSGMSGAAGAVAAAVEAAGGQVRARLDLVDGVAAEVPAGRLGELAQDSAVRAVTADRAARYEEFSYDETTTASNFPKSTQATKAWSLGARGRGIGVAVLDTGVSPHADFGGRLVQGPDLSGEGTIVDSYGHGTVMAGLVAGSGADSAGLTTGMHVGVAPEATVVAVKTAGRNGVVDVSTMLQALHWVSAYRAQYNIRVLSLSWGVKSTQDPALDPLNYAVERLWGEGIVVVVAAGNSGPNAGTVTKPGDDPVVITAGAYDDKQDLDANNDGVTSWSSRGPTAQGLVKPDLVVPARTVISARSLGSKVEVDNPKAWIAPSYIKGSGTSQAAAVASGLAALLLSARPELTPDQVKALLTSTALPIAGSAATAQGAGRVQLAAALTATPTLLAQPRPATGLGSLERARGVMHVTSECNGVVTEIRGEIDVHCEPWDPAAWTGTTWKGDAWTGTTWKGTEWNGTTWKNVWWSDAAWSGTTWKGGTWVGDSWQGLTAWTGTTWAGTTWKGTTWKGTTWKGTTWADTGWTTGEWTTAEYEEFLTAFWGPQPPPGVILPGEAAADDALSIADGARQRGATMIGTNAAARP